MSPRTNPAIPTARTGRLRKAQQFQLAADVVDEYGVGDASLADAYVTLCVHAGIAAADVICMDRLGVYSRGEGHDEAIELLARADKAASKELAALLAMKPKAGYSDVPVRRRDSTRASRAMAALVETAQGRT
jgi:hypothetical protein